jgi:chromosome segregation ATPase
MRVKVENFQSIKRAELEIKGLTVVTGENSIGKSALARALAGAFSNLRGTSHVRNGEKFSSVEVSFDDGNTLVWEKGSNRNKYVVNGAELERVGSEVPDEVKALGVHAIDLDNREVWPQVAKQFQTIFLLDLPPSVLSSALSDVDVIQKIEQASQRARSDVRETTSRLKYKQEDLTLSKRTLEAYEDFDISLLRNVEELENQLAKITAQISELESIATKRQAEASKLDALAYCPKTPIQEINFKRYEPIQELTRLCSRRNKLYLLEVLLSVALDEIQIPSLPRIPNSTEKLERAHIKRDSLKTTISTTAPVKSLAELPLISEEIKKLPLLERLMEQRMKCRAVISEVSGVREIPQVGVVVNVSEITDMMNRKTKTMWGLGLAQKEVEMISAQLEEVQASIGLGVCPLCLRGGCTDKGGNHA